MLLCCCNSADSFSEAKVCSGLTDGTRANQPLPQRLCLACKAEGEREGQPEGGWATPDWRVQAGR